MIMHHFDFWHIILILSTDDDASCRVVWTYGGWSQKLGQVMAVCVNRCGRKETDAAACQRKETHWLRRSDTNQVKTFAHSAFFFFIRCLHGIVIHIFSIQYQISKIQGPPSHSGLSFLSSLTSLNLSNCRLASLSPLSSYLPSLTKLTRYKATIFLTSSGALAVTLRH